MIERLARLFTGLGLGFLAVAALLLVAGNSPEAAYYNFPAETFADFAYLCFGLAIPLFLIHRLHDKPE